MSINMIGEAVVNAVRREVPYSSNIPFFSNISDISDFLMYEKNITSDTEKAMSFEQEVERIALAVLHGKIGDCTELSRLTYVLLKYVKIRLLNGHVCELIKLDKWYHYFVILYPIKLKNFIDSLMLKKPSFTTFIHQIKNKNILIIDSWLGLSEVVGNDFFPAFRFKCNKLGIDFSGDKRVTPFPSNISFEMSQNTNTLISDRKNKEIYDYYFSRLAKNVIISANYLPEKYLYKQINQKIENRRRGCSIFQNSARNTIKPLVNTEGISRGMNASIPSYLLIDFLSDLKKGTSFFSNMTSYFSKKGIFDEWILIYKNYNFDVPTLILKGHLICIISISLMRRTRSQNFSLDIHSETATGRKCVSLLNRNKYKKIKLIVSENSIINYSELRKFLVENIPQISRNIPVVISKLSADFIENAKKIPDWIRKTALH